MSTQMAQEHGSTCQSHCTYRVGLIGGYVVVLGLALLWAARAAAIPAPPLMLEFVSAGSLEH